MGENTINMNRTQLKEMIDKSVSKVLTELDWKTYANAAKKAHNRGEHERTRKFRDAAINSFNDEHGYEDGKHSLKLKSLYDDDFEEWRPRDKDGNIISRLGGSKIEKLTPNTPHMSLHYQFKDDDSDYESMAKSSSDFESDNGLTVAGNNDYHEHPGFGMVSSPMGDDFPLGKIEEYEPGKWRAKNKKPFKEFDDYRRGNYVYDDEQGWHLRESSLKEGYGDSDYAITERAEEMINDAFDYGYIEEGESWEEIVRTNSYIDESAQSLSEEFDINIDDAFNYLQKAFNNYENMYEGKNMKQVTISESKLREMIKESTKRILKENFDDDDIFITAYDIIQNGVDEIVQKHGVTPNVAAQELLKVLNTFEGDDIYDDGDEDLGDYDSGEDENF